MARCEVCERNHQQVRLITCSSMEQPMLDFCPEHYIEHVEGAHDGVPLPGAMSLDEARKLCEGGSGDV